MLQKQNKADRFRGKIREYMEIKHISSLEELRLKSTRIGSNTTFLRCWKNPNLFRVEDIFGIIYFLEIPSEELLTFLEK